MATMASAHPLVGVRRRRFTVEDYHRMGEAGILTEDDRVELIEGTIVELSPIRDPHARAVNHLTEFLVVRLAGGDVTVSVQNPIRLSGDTEPQPDLAVLRGRDRGLAEAADVLLVIEVADTSRRYDRNVKLPLYAAAGIPEAWLVDLGADTVERYSQPAQGQYRTKQTFERGQTVVAGAVTGLSLDVEAIFGG